MLEMLREHLHSRRAEFRAAGSSIKTLSRFLREGTRSVPESCLDLPMAIPRMLEYVGAVAADESLDPMLRAICGGVYGYVFNPFDIIDDEKHGYLGFVDDAIVTFYGVKKLETYFPGNRFAPKESKRIAAMVKAWERVLAPELVAILRGQIEQIAAIVETADFSTLEGKKPR
jgi:uncharacterized membrane protein YkvA (DUF1232 family)